jgi:hypothetical protein
MEENKPDKITLTVQDILPAAIFEAAKESVEFILLRGAEEIPMSVEFVKVENPSPDIFIKALLKVTNESIFNIIKEVQKQSPEDRIATLDKVKKLDAKVDEYSANAMKIKDKEIRKQLMDEVLTCK